ncbi:uncharacterized protein LAJ45_01028 [Morchella importuna]|uniref:uncharacterized protein n=1 Tax=Morchella importuna TaxID=1174673 RepID=UPI001E8EF1C7|nr:uncharacterized protein LAJ45_01028 [Morchella importuna]KAH8154500.1 hypothetical protein LAJ45_01028 [Morchella importuna]
MVDMFRQNAVLPNQVHGWSLDRHARSFHAQGAFYWCLYQLRRLPGVLSIQMDTVLDQLLKRQKSVVSYDEV